MNRSNFSNQYFSDDLNQPPPKKLKECIDQLREGMTTGEAAKLIDELHSNSIPLIASKEDVGLEEVLNLNTQVQQLKRFLFHLDKIYPG